MSKARDVADSYTDVEVDAKDATVQTQVNDRYTKSESDGRYLQNGDAITSNNGNVGIGTSSPTYPLHVQGQVGIELYNTTGGGNALNFRPSLGDANKYNLSITSYDHSADGTAHADGLSINGYDGVSFCTGSNSRQERMRIDSAGRVTMPYQPAFDVSRISSQEGLSGTIIHNNAYVNKGGHWSSSSGRFTAPIGGTYYFYTSYIKNNQSGVGRRDFRKNGAKIQGGRHLRHDTGQPYGNNGVLAAIMYLNAGDYVAVYHYEGTSFGGSEYDYFGGYLIG
jgi:hypothetical protein